MANARATQVVRQVCFSSTKSACVISSQDSYYAPALRVASAVFCREVGAFPPSAWSAHASSGTRQRGACARARACAADVHVPHNRSGTGAAAAGLVSPLWRRQREHSTKANERHWCAATGPPPALCVCHLTYAADSCAHARRLDGDADAARRQLAGPRDGGHHRVWHGRGEPAARAPSRRHRPPPPRQGAV